MFQWSDEHQMIRDAVRRFVDDEIRPHVDELEHGDLPPYDILRKLFATFGMDSMARESFAKGIEREKAMAAGEDVPEKKSGGDGGGMSLIPIIELCRVCPGMVTAMGVSMGLTSAAIMSKGTIAQKERWALDLLTMDKVGAWAITEPGTGSDAFGSMKLDGAPRRRRVPAERVEDVHHQRPVRRHDRVHLQARRGRDTPRPSARCSRSCSTGACPVSSSPSRCARWGCTPRPPANCSSTTSASGVTA